MKSSFLRAAGALLCLLTITACAKKEAPSELKTAGPEARPDENVVSLTNENLVHVALQTEEAKRASLDLILRAVGRVQENLAKTAKVTTTLEGRLVRLNFDLNDRVKAGDVVGLVQTPELLGKPLELKAPIDGVIVERKSTVGELIGRETEVYTISDPTDLWLIVEVKERDLGAVRVGQEAEFTVLAYPGETFRGRVTRLGHRVEPESRTLEVRAEVANRDGRLKPGMFADVEIATTAVQDVLTVSDAALQTMDEAQVVFVATSDTRFEKRVVKPGLEQRGRVQILDGVKAGERVVTEGSFILKSELLKGQLGEE